MQCRLHHEAGAVVIFLEVEPLGGHVENVLVARVALQEIIHAGDRGEQVAVLDAGHPADKELLIGGCGGEKRLGFGEGGGIRHDSAGREREHGVGEGGLRIRFGGTARQNRGAAVDGILIIVDSLLEQATSFHGTRGEGDSAKELLAGASYVRRTGSGAGGSVFHVRRGSLPPDR